MYTKDHAETTLNDIYSSLYYADRLVQHFRDTFFQTDEEHYLQDEQAKRVFTYSYEEMSAVLFAISEILFNIRLQAEFALNLKTPQVEAHIRNETEMMSWISDDKR